MTCPGGPAPLKDIVSGLISKLGKGSEGEKRLGQEEIERIWKLASGNFAARRSRPTSLKKGRLIVMVGDSSLLYDLTLKKQNILEVLKKELDGRVKEVQFRIGDTGGKRKTKRTKNKK